ncbi:hypothetical protein ACE6H2_010284 [Prunus campanulata]
MEKLNRSNSIATAQLLTPKFIVLSLSPSPKCDDCGNSDEASSGAELEDLQRFVTRVQGHESGVEWAGATEFFKATIAYKNKVNSSTSVPQPLKIDGEMEMKRKKIVRSFSIARNIYSGGLGSGLQPIKESELEARAEFLDF